MDPSAVRGTRVQKKIQIFLALQHLHPQGEAPEIARPIVIEAPAVADEALAAPLQTQAIAAGTHGIRPHYVTAERNPLAGTLGVRQDKCREYTHRPKPREVMIRKLELRAKFG